MTTLADMERHAVPLQRTPPLTRETVDELTVDQRRRWTHHWRNVRDSGDPYAADGLFYHDSRPPFMTADQTSVTLLSTDVALYPPGAFPELGKNYFNFVGKKLHIRAFGKITTGTTPGNGTVDVYWGSGASATGTIIVSSAAITLTASQSNVSWSIELWVHARSLGSAGTLFAQGTCQFGTAVVSVGTFLLPAASAAAVTCDLTVDNIISVQYKRSGSTVEGMTTQDLEVSALN